MAAIRKHLSYANVVATIALFAALGGGAYASGLIGSHDVRNDSLRSVDLRNHRGVSGRDVKRGTLKTREIEERTLRSAQFAPIAGDSDANCDPTTTAYVECVSTKIDLPRKGQALVVATGQYFSEGGAANVNCGIAIDEAEPPTDVFVGEENDDTSLGSTSGFSVTRVSDGLQRGSHDFSLKCAEPGPGDGRIAVATIAVLGVGG